MDKQSKIRKLFDDFKQLRIMVIGDVMVDSYLWGKVERISPEAPIPVVALKKRENRMGGAANVALNIRALGAVPVLCSVIGDDDKGKEFTGLLQKEGISTEGLITGKERITTTKFRIFGNAYQMLRVDEETDEPLGETDHAALFNTISSQIRNTPIHGIIFQDYDKGVITPGLISKVVSLANEFQIPVSVDPKRRNFLHYQGVTLFKPNLKEMKEGINISSDLQEMKEIEEAAILLRKKLECKYLLTTLSEKGVMISEPDGKGVKNTFIPAHLRLISDVSGAGDTVITVATLCLALNCSPYEVAYISNLAGGLVCEEVGVVPVNRDKLLREVLHLL